MRAAYRNARYGAVADPSISPKLREHLGSVVTLMKLSRDWPDFKAKLDLIHPSLKKNMPAPLWLDESDLGM